MGEWKYKQENLAKAAAAVEKAREHFRALGFYVSDAEHPAKNGSDLDIWRADPAGDHLPPVFRASVEVKCIGVDRGFYRARDRHRKKGEDFIAFVFPSGYVHVEDFATHERLRCADGGRHFTKLGRLLSFTARQAAPASAPTIVEGIF